MSSAGRNPNRGPKGPKAEKSEKAPSKTEPVTDKNKLLETNPKVQATAEQMRIAQMINSSKIDDDPLLQEKINQVIQITGLSQDDAMIALYDCDNDPNRAINMLIEGDGQGEWQESTKKKKSKPPGGNIKSLVDGLVNNKENRRNDQSRERDFTSDRERSRNRAAPPRMRRGGGSSSDKSWKGKENQENEKNLEDTRENSRRRMANGPGSRGVGRGGRRGMGPRTYQNRSDFPRQIDTWSNAQAENSGGTSGEGMQVGNWDDGFPTTEDWDNEEWTGSLSDTKVFTPTSVAAADQPHKNVIAYPKQDLPLPTTDNLGPSLASPPMSQSIDLATLLAKPSASVSEPSLSNSLATQQQQFLSQFTQQATESLKSAVGVGTSSGSSAGAIGSYGAQTPSNFDSFPSAGMAYPSDSFSTAASSFVSQLKTTSTSGTTPPATTSIQHGIPARNKVSRPRVPPPSKIPASAVEMPDDSIAALDVQFGGLEFGTEPYEFSSEQQASFQTKEKTTPNKDLSQANIANKINSSEAVPYGGSQATERKPQNPSFNQSQSSPLDLNKAETSTSNNLSGFPNKQNASLYASHKASPASYSSGSTYNQQNYGVDQGQSAVYGSTASSGYPVQNSNYAASQSLTQSPYQNQTANAYTQANSYQSNQVTNSYPSSAGYPNTSQSASSNYPSGNQTNSNYQGSSPTSNSFQATPTYGNSSFSASSNGQYQSSYGVSASTSTTHSHNSLGNIASSKLTSSLSGTSKDNQFESAPSSSANLSSVLSGSVNNVSTSGANIPKTSTTKSGNVANMPPGVPAMLGTHQYFLGQAGLPFYPGVQQAMYAYEDLHALQQRLPHMAPTSLSAGRDNAALGSMAYSGTEGKFSRTDNSSPVPSTLSQPNASTHQQPFFNAATAAALPPGYPYFAYGGAVVPQYSIYPAAVPSATNTHGVTNNTQFQKVPYGTNTYNSYDSLTAATNQAQDYKSVYGTSGGANVGMTAAQAQSKMGLSGNSNSGAANSDLTSSMYGKMQLSKSFDKQGFHTGTPPPFNLAGAQTNTLAAAPSGYPHTMFIPAMPQHSPLMPHQAHQDSTGSGGQRSGSQPGKGTAKQAYNTGYWAN